MAFEIIHYCDRCKKRVADPNDPKEALLFHLKLDGGLKRPDQTQPTVLHEHPVGLVSMQRVYCMECAPIILDRISKIEEE